MRAAANGVDWRGFLRVAERHRIEGLAREALVRAGAPVDSGVARALGDQAARIARQGLIFAAETHRLQNALDAAGIGNLVLKGAALEMLAYGALGLKSAWDIDLLVTPQDASRARAVLENAGYALTSPPEPSPLAFAQWVDLAKECVFTHLRTGTPVELHWRLVDSDLLLGLSARSAWQTVYLAPDMPVRTLATEGLFAYLSVHGASHGWSRLKWLADLGALLARCDAANLDRLLHSPEAVGAGVCPATALHLCRQLLGRPLSNAPGLAQGRNAKARWLAGFALHVMAGGGAREIAERPLLGELIVLSHLLFADGGSYRRHEFGRLWLSVHDRRHIHLPGPLTFIYSLIRGPLWIWRRLPRRRAGL